jgi:PTH1 family peptidyl-tRNA hydrolase
MKLVVGLGNPGEKYKNTRHNVGFLLVEKLAQGSWKLSRSSAALFSWVELNGRKVELAKPQCFMNRSGVTVKKIIKQHPGLQPQDIYIAHDDLDIKLGEFKLVFGKGPKVHNGLRSIYEQLGTKDFWHLRLGVDNRQKTGFKGTGEDYVLGQWSRIEKLKIEKVIDEAVKRLLKHELFR